MEVTTKNHRMHNRASELGGRRILDISIQEFSHMSVKQMLSEGGKMICSTRQCQLDRKAKLCPEEVLDGVGSRRGTHLVG